MLKPRMWYLLSRRVGCYISSCAVFLPVSEGVRVAEWGVVEPNQYPNQVRLSVKRNFMLKNEVLGAILL